MSWPELSVRIKPQSKPTGAYLDSRMNIEDLEDADAAEIRAGKALMLEVQLIRKVGAKDRPAVLDTLYNRVASPESVGITAIPNKSLTRTCAVTPRTCGPPNSAI
ncbi:hypothetical protein ACWDBD_32080 [Streptomyces sp. NPDC001118]